jgi:glycine cleavage system H protein
VYPSDLKYTTDHEWIRVSDTEGRIGITDYAQKQLGDVVFMELPEVGASLTKGQPFGSIESVKAVSELFAPVSGVVTAVNAELKNQPERVNTAPHDSWMIAVRLADPGEVSGLLDSTQYAALAK